MCALVCVYVPIFWGPTGPSSSSAERERCAFSGEERETTPGERTHAHTTHGTILLSTFYRHVFPLLQMAAPYEYVPHSTKQRKGREATDNKLQRDDADGYESSLFKCKTYQNTFAITHEEGAYVQGVIDCGITTNKWKRTDPCSESQLPKWKKVDLPLSFEPG